MVEGWFKTYRKLGESDRWLSEKFSRGQAWLDLIMLANWKPGFVRPKGRKVEIQRGQLARSQVWLAARWHWSRGKVQRFLDELETDHDIEQVNLAVTTLITIVRYDEYQGTSSEQDTTRAADSAADRAADRAADSAQLKNNQESNNSKEPEEAKETPKRFRPPTADELKTYCDEKGYASVDPGAFIDYYESKGWMVGTSKMKDWKRAASGWNRREQKPGGRTRTGKPDRLAGIKAFVEKANAEDAERAEAKAAEEPIFQQPINGIKQEDLPW
jgi:hypothetical protein